MILIFGTGGFSKVIADIVEKEKKHQILGFVDTSKTKEEKFLGYDVFNYENDLIKLLRKDKTIGGVIAIGDNFVRKKVREEIISLYPNFNFLSCIHPSSIIGRDVHVGKGTVILAGAIIQPFSTVGEHCILNVNSTLGHDCQMLNYSSISSNAIVGGGCKIGQYSAVCIGATLLHNIEIGNNCVVGGGALVTKNIENNSLSYGVPSKFIRSREEGEKYL